MSVRDHGYVVRARLCEVALPLREPFRISTGVVRERRSLIVVLEDGTGCVGYGESAPFAAPFYSSETLASARALLVDELLGRVLGAPLSDPSSLHALLSRGIVGNRMARAGVETAWWDLAARRRRMSLAECVSGRLRELGVEPRWSERASVIECGIALGIPEQRDAGTLAEWVRAAVQAGYRRVKLKIQPGWDEEPVSVTREVLRRMHVDVPVTVDANGAYRWDRDAAHLRRLDALGLLYIEQPLPGDALWDLCELHRALKTPTCLDETLTSDDAARQILQLNGPSVWNIKVQRVGGLEEACRMYARAVRSGVKLWGGTMPESGIGAQAMLALGCHRGFVYPSDIEPSDRWYAPGCDTMELVMRPDGTMAVPVERPDLNTTAVWQEVAVLP